MKVLFLALLLTSFSVHSAPIATALKGLNDQEQLDSFAPLNDVLTLHVTSSKDGHAKHQGIMGPFIASGDAWDDVVMREVTSNSFYQQPEGDKFRIDVRSVPEPGSVTLIGLGLAVLAIAPRKRRSQASVRRRRALADWQGKVAH